MSTILETLVRQARDRVASARRERSSASLRAELTPAHHEFLTALRDDGLSLIAECKKASPSAGVIRADYDVAALAAQYRPYAQALSILTEPAHFKGDLAHLALAAEAAPELPRLRKDFIVDAYQVYEARAHGADAVLLIARALTDDARLGDLLAITDALGMDALVEVHDEAEIDRALTAGAPIVGINNRCLDDFRIDLTTTQRLAPRVPPSVLTVAESGLKTPADLDAVRGAVDAVLIGTKFMRAPDVGAAVQALFPARADSASSKRRGFEQHGSEPRA